MSSRGAVWRSVIEQAPVPLARLEAVRDPEGRVTDFVFRYINPRGAESAWPGVEALEGRRLLAEIGGGDERTAALVDALQGVMRTDRPWSLRDFRLPDRMEGDGSGIARFDVSASRLDDEVVLTWFASRGPAGQSARRNHADGLHRHADEEREGRQEWLATLRHELTNSVNTMLGYCDLLQSEISGALNERQKDELGRIRRACAHLTSLVDDSFASFHRSGSASPVRREEVDVRETVGDVVGLMRPEAERRGLRLEMRCPERGAVVQTDGGKLRQILINLLGNALKYTEEGGVEVEVNASDEEWLYLRVRDSGPGIPEEQRDQIFEPYVRLDEGRAEEERTGSGLGLAVCRDLAERLGGEVSLEGASSSEGSTFSVRLPRREPSSASSSESHTA